MNSRAFRGGDCDVLVGLWWRLEVGCRGKVGEAGSAHACKFATDLLLVFVVLVSAVGVARGGEEGAVAEGSSRVNSTGQCVASESRGGAALSGEVPEGLGMGDGDEIGSE